MNEKEEEIEDVTSYHVFGLGWSSDVKYNRKLIRVLNKAINDNQEDLYKLVNRTDIALDQIHIFAESVMNLEMRFLGRKSSVEKTFMEVRQAQKAAVLYQALLPMVLEEEMGRVVYCESLKVTPTSTAILAVLLAVPIILICAAVWRKRRRFRKKKVDGLYIQFSTPHHLEPVFLGELTIPYDHTFTEGNILVTDVVVNQFCLRYMLMITWGLQLKEATTRPGQHPANIPLPETIADSKKLARLMLGTAKYMTMTRLLKYSCNLAMPIPMGVPRLVDAGWSDLGGENFPA